MKKYYILAILSFVGVIAFAISTATLDGELSAMVVPRQTITDWSNVKVDLTLPPSSKGTINGDTVLYDATSYIRCDELYKHFHLIGYGNPENGKEMVYLYKLNLDKFFVTQEELIAIYAKLKKEGKI